MSITLHKEYGLNPHLTYCPKCGEDAEQLILTGSGRKRTCESCKSLFIGPIKTKLGEYKANCPKCGGDLKDHGVPPPEERLPSMEPCDKCKKQLAELDDAVKEGGIYWRCADCGSNGAIKKSGYADGIRRMMGIPSGPCGAEFTKTDCPVCVKKDPVVDGDSAAYKDN